MQCSTWAAMVLVLVVGVTLACQAQSQPDDKKKPPEYRLALEAVMQKSLDGAELAGAIKSPDRQRHDGVKALGDALEMLSKLPDEAEILSQLRAANRAWAEVGSGPLRKRHVNLLDLGAEEAASELELLKDSMRVCLRQMARSAKLAADESLEPKDRLVAALDVQHWRQNLTNAYGNFWVHHWPGLFIYQTNYERVVESEVYRGGFTGGHKLKQDVFETEGNSVSAQLVPALEQWPKEEKLNVDVLRAQIPPSIDVYRQDPKSWPKIRRVVPKGTVIGVDLCVWTHRVTNANLEVYARVGDESKGARFLDIGPLCEWDRYPHLRKPKALYLTTADMPEVPKPGDAGLPAPPPKSQEES